jgi:hypothetical protein
MLRTQAVGMKSMKLLAGAGIKFRLRLRVRQSPKGYLYSKAVVGKLLLKSTVAELGTLLQLLVKVTLYF